MRNTTKGFFFAKSSNVPEAVEIEDTYNNIIKWGKDNLYPQWLNSLFYSSAIHSGIIRSKVHYTVSGGLKYEGSDIEKFNEFVKNGNSDFDLSELTEQMSLDNELSSMIVLRGMWSLDKSRIEKVEIIDYETVRKQLDSDRIVVSSDWSDKKQTLRYISPFNPADRSEREFYLMYQEAPKQSLIKKKLSLGIYPNAPYSGGLTSIMTDVEITNYQLNEIANGFSTGTIINLNNGDIRDEEAKRSLERDIKEGATGSGNAGGTMVLYNNGKDREATVVNISGNDLNARYLALSKDVRDNIVLSHSVTTPILFGVKQEGSLGNSTELKVGYKIMNANYFKYKRRAITNMLNYLGKYGYGLQGKISFNDVKLDLDEEVEVDKVEDTKSQMSKFEAETNVLEQFKKCGVDRNAENVLFTRVLPNEFDIDEQKLLCLEEFKKDAFAGLNEAQINILNLINENNTFDAIYKALKVNPSDLVKEWGLLIKQGYIEKGKLTTKGKTNVAKSDATKIEIYYSYDKNPAIKGDDIIPTTREFCRELVNMSKTKVWSKEDIDRISGFVGYNAFAYRGGWYHNPDTKKNTPWCRHVWKQEIIYK